MAGNQGNPNPNLCLPLLQLAGADTVAVLQWKADGGDRRAIMESSRLYPSIVSSFYYCILLLYPTIASYYCQLYPTKVDGGDNLTLEKSQLYPAFSYCYWLAACLSIYCLVGR